MKPACAAVLRLLALASLLNIFELSQAQQVDSLKRLHTEVFDKYVPVIPICNQGPIVVNFDWSIYTLLRVDDVIEILDITAWYTMSWNDCGLRWNLTDYNGTLGSEFPTTMRIWTPDMTWMERIPFVDAFEFTDGLFSGARAYVTNNGEVEFSRVLFMRSYCQMSIQYFPFDTQQCKITFTPWSYSVQYVMLRTNQTAANINSLVPSDSWNIISVPVKSKNVSDAATGGYFAELQFIILMTRKPMFYMFYLMLPFFVVSLLNSFVFLIPPQAQEKIAFSLAILLSLSMYMMLMIDLTPPKPEIPLLSIYFFTVFVLSIISSALTVLVEVIHAHHSLHAPPKWLSRLFTTGLGTCCFFRQVESANSDEFSTAHLFNLTALNYLGAATDSQLTPAENPTQRQERRRPEMDYVKEWRQIAFAIDRLLFIVYCLLSLLVFVVLIAVATSLQANLIVPK